MATLDYSSVQHWIKLAFKAKQLLDTQGYDLNNPDHTKQAVKDIAVEAADMGFALGVGRRWYGLTGLLHELDGNETEGPLYNAWWVLRIENYRPPTKKDIFRPGERS